MKHIATPPEVALADLLADYHRNGCAGVTIGGVQLSLTTVRTGLFGEPTGETELRGQGIRTVVLAKSEIRRYARMLGLCEATAPEWCENYWAMRGRLPVQTQAAA